MAGYCFQIRVVSNSSTKAKTVKMIDLEKDDDTFSQADVNVVIAREIQKLINKHSRAGYRAAGIQVHSKWATLGFVSPEGREIDYQLVVLRTEHFV